MATPPANATHTVVDAQDPAMIGATVEIEDGRFPWLGRTVTW